MSARLKLPESPQANLRRDAAPDPSGASTGKKLDSEKIRSKIVPGDRSRQPRFGL